MIYFKNQYARVWRIFKNDGRITASISTTEKDREGNKIYSNWSANFLGEALKKAEHLNAETNIQITSGKVTTRVVEKDGKKISYTNVTIFDFDYATNSAPLAENTSKTEEVEEDGIPWE